MTDYAYQYLMEMELFKTPSESFSQLLPYGIRVKRVQGLGLFIIGLGEGSIAERAGLRFGDVIEKIGNSDTRAEEIPTAKAVTLLNSGDSVKINIRKQPSFLLQRSSPHTDWGFSHEKNIIGLDEFTKGSPAALIGLPRNQAIISINGISAMCLDDGQIQSILRSCESHVTIRVMDAALYTEFLNCCGLSKEASYNSFVKVFPPELWDKDEVQKVLEDPGETVHETAFNIYKEGYELRRRDYIDDCSAKSKEGEKVKLWISTYNEEKHTGALRSNSFHLSSLLGMFKKRNELEEKTWKGKGRRKSSIFGNLGLKSSSPAVNSTSKGIEKNHMTQSGPTDTISKPDDDLLNLLGDSQIVLNALQASESPARLHMSNDTFAQDAAEITRSDRASPSAHEMEKAPPKDEDGNWQAPHYTLDSSCDSVHKGTNTSVQKSANALQNATQEVDNYDVGRASPHFRTNASKHPETHEKERRLSSPTLTSGEQAWQDYCNEGKVGKSDRLETPNTHGADVPKRRPLSAQIDRQAQQIFACSLASSSISSESLKLSPALSAKKYYSTHQKSTGRRRHSTREHDGHQSHSETEKFIIPDFALSDSDTNYEGTSKAKSMKQAVILRRVLVKSPRRVAQGDKGAPCTSRPRRNTLPVPKSPNTQSSTPKPRKRLTADGRLLAANLKPRPRSFHISNNVEATNCNSVTRTRGASFSQKANSTSVKRSPERKSELRHTSPIEAPVVDSIPSHSNARPRDRGNAKLGKRHSSPITRSQDSQGSSAQNTPRIVYSRVKPRERAPVSLSLSTTPQRSPLAQTNDIVASPRPACTLRRNMIVLRGVAQGVDKVRSPLETNPLCFRVDGAMRSSASVPVTPQAKKTPPKVKRVFCLGNSININDAILSQSSIESGIGLDTGAFNPSWNLKYADGARKPIVKVVPSKVGSPLAPRIRRTSNTA